MNFKQYILEPGVYAAALATHNDPDRIAKLTSGIEGTAPEQLHCTIAFSKMHVPVETLTPVLEIWDDELGDNILCTEIRVFNNPTANVIGQPPVGALVLVLDCPIMHAMHKACRELGCSYDHNEYIPHVTLLYGVPLSTASDAAKRIQEQIDAEPLTVTLFGPYIEPLKD